MTYDPTQPPTYEKVTQSAHIGYEAVLWKLVTENGQTDIKQINSSSYKAVPRYVTRGSGKPVETPKPTDQPVVDDEPESAGGGGGTEEEE